MKKKVVHYIATLKNGGAQTQVILLCNQIDLSKFDVFIVCWDRESTLPIREGIKIIELERGNKYNLIKFFSSVFKTTKEIKPDIAHLWLPEILTVPAAFTARYLNIPIINSERRLPSTNFKILWLRDRIEYLIHIFSNAVVTNFPTPIKRKSVFNQLVHNSGKGITIFNGLDIENLNSIKNLSNLNRNSKTFNLVYCGRLVLQKNIDLLLAAIKQLLDQNYSLKLSIIGIGEMEESLRTYVKNNNLSEHVEFLGYRNDWKKIAVNSDAFILPTSREGMPNVLFEAIAIGLPIIATDIEEISCHFRDEYDSLLMKPNNISSMVHTIEKAINNPLLLESIKANADLTVKKYTVESMVNQYEKLYDSLL
jgi:glycosyltransferase involved in cell wall biosynthesis